METLALKPQERGPSDVPGCDCGVHPGGVGAPGHRSEGAVLRGCQDSKPDVVSQLEQSGSPWMAWRGITRGLSPGEQTKRLDLELKSQSEASNF
ncbi:uncharacterized protein LOC120606817 isoform X8 [Pteropus medius]|uniref:uncharacterized protein LOC120606817 isoform X8 n=1 Tax=Pteropus vampyrus TaxID=132908 RepID=UPI00196B68F3|nr:uncharacterized protein LOC120606817 isoform X8 [Pteropus giganteus]